MSELSSALFLIADGNEFRFARFYIVYEGVQLGRLESPLIVFGVPDMSPSDCPNVEETRNPMQISGRKKCSHFFTKNIPSAFHLKSKGMIPSSYFFSRQTGLSAESDSPVFVQSAEEAGLFAGHLLFLLHDHFLDHLAADASGLCGSQVAVVAVL